MCRDRSGGGVLIRGALFLCSRNFAKNLFLLLRLISLY